MDGKMKKRGVWSLVFMGFSFMFMFMPACKTDITVGGFEGSSDMFYYDGNVGSIYEFTFGSDTLGKYDIDSTGFSLPLFLGFVGIVVSTILGIAYIASSSKSWRIKLSETIASGVAAFFMSPIFSVSTVNSFYDSLPESLKDPSYGRYKNFRFGFSFVLLFLVLLVAFIYNMRTTMAIKRDSN